MAEWLRRQTRTFGFSYLLPGSRVTKIENLKMFGYLFSSEAQVQILLVSLVFRFYFFCLGGFGGGKMDDVDGMGFDV